MFQYTKYIIWRIAGPTILICFSLTGIAWLTQSLKFLDLIVNRGLDFSTFIYLSSLLLPSLLWVIIPISVFIGVLFVYNKLVFDNELIILRSAGVNRMGQIKPALIFAGMVTIFSYFIALYLLPSSSREFKDMQSFIRDNYASLLLQDGVFASPTQGLTVYIRERDDDGMLIGLLVHDTRSEGKVITMMAEKGRLVKSSSGPRFILINGNRQEMDKAKRQLSLLYFDRYALELEVLKKSGVYDRWREPQERYINELFYPTDNTTNEVLLQKLRAEGHHRITWPLYNILLTLIALIAFITGEFNRHGNSKKIVAVSILTSGIIIWALGINNIVASKSEFTSVIYITVMGGIMLTIYILIKKPTLKKKEK